MAAIAAVIIAGEPATIAPAATVEPSSGPEEVLR
jgi:hypothetical protein